MEGPSTMTPEAINEVLAGGRPYHAGGDAAAPCTDHEVCDQAAEVVPTLLIGQEGQGGLLQLVGGLVLWRDTRVRRESGPSSFYRSSSVLEPEPCTPLYLRGLRGHSPLIPPQPKLQAQLMTQALPPSPVMAWVLPAGVSGAQGNLPPPQERRLTSF